MYQALYRKWRPKTFDDVAGQEHITTTLRNELKNDRISHAYLFTGSRGTGKTTCAKILAKAVNCLNPKDGSPCGECEICREIDNGTSIDVFEMDAASNRKIDDIRSVIDEVQGTPYKCRYKVYIVDEVHMLTAESFNALLKILEEPPSHVIFILATTEVHKIMLTIQSRCQRFDFHRIPPRDIADRLLYVANHEDITLDDAAAMLIASVSDGAMRDALSLLDRCIAISREVSSEVVRTAAGLADKGYLYDLAACVINKNTAKALGIIDRLYGEAKDMSLLCDELIAHFRALMLIKSVSNPRDIVVFTDSEFEQSVAQADYLSLADIVFYMDVLSRAYQRMGKGTGDRTELEMAVVKLCSPELDVTNESIAARITALEQAVRKGIAYAAPAQPAPMPLTDGEKVRTEEPQKAEDTAPTELQKQDAVISEEKTEQKVQTAEPKPEPKPEEKPAQKAAPKQKQGDVDIVKLSREAKPFSNWSELVESFRGTSATIAASLSGSEAFVNGNYLLIKAESDLAFEMLKKPEKRRAIREALVAHTGRQYRLGPYRIEEKKQEAADPLQQFKNKLAESGIKYTEE
ncbi:MAG: DNA polymerase III subunit gamma/tau [Ruminococcus sp.]|nr:DNA polymerase III subunit gamma/tau [Ruminococcus sp.]